MALTATPMIAFMTYNVNIVYTLDLSFKLRFLTLATVLCVFQYLTSRWFRTTTGATQFLIARQLVHEASLIEP